MLNVLYIFIACQDLDLPWPEWPDEWPEAADDFTVEPSSETDRHFVQPRFRWKVPHGNTNDYSSKFCTYLLNQSYNLTLTVLNF